MVISYLKCVFLGRQRPDAFGFTLTENLVALLILVITLSAISSGFMGFTMENSNNRILSAAIALANNQLEDLRRQNISSLTLGATTQPNLTSSDFTYKLIQYICTAQPTNITTTNPTCSTTVDPNNSNRYILIKIQKNNNNYEDVYSIQTVFTKLQ